MYHGPHWILIISTPKRAETGLILLVYAGEFEIKTQNSDKNLL